MLHRFGPCVLDEARRSLTADGREIRLQPRVFDLLCYLLRNRDRVVTKDELLDTLWPGTVVVDNALQRVVSLARAALEPVGLAHAVRTYARHGYRFCLEGEACADPAEADDGGLVRAARAACDSRDWDAACDAFSAADRLGALRADDVEQWGRAAICAGRGPSAAAALERQAAQCESAGDLLGAARATLLLVQIRIDQKEGVVASGLLQRAARHVADQPACAERGHYAWMASRFALGSGDPVRAQFLADEACRVGRELRDADIECLGLVYRAHALMAQGDLPQAQAHQEEAAALIRMGRVQSWAAGWALCSILYAARHRCDWVLAAQVADVYADWSRSARMPAFPGTCQLHRAAVMGVRGDTRRAVDEVRSAAGVLAQIAPWAEGDAHCVLGDLLVLAGCFDEAEAAYRRAHALGWEPQPGLARLHLLTGRAELAQRGVERALETADWTLRERRGDLLCMLVHAALAAGDADRARHAARMLDEQPALLPTAALQALHAAAIAELAAHDGDLAGARRRLRQAVHHWREIGSPLLEAEARLRLAECLLLEADAAGAELELHAIDAGAAAGLAMHADRLARCRAQVRQQLDARRAGGRLKVVGQGVRR